MIPVTPLEYNCDLRTAQAKHQTVFWRQAERQRDACENCGDLGVLWFQFTTGAPMRFPPGGKTPITFHDGMWYQVESRTYPCPVCQDRTKYIAYLFEQSGLDPFEREWRLDYYKGTSKDGAISNCNAILAQVPRPVGWYVFVGDYGMGKTGMLKSIVAACTRAGVKSKYLRAFDVLAQIKDTYGDDSPMDESDLLKSYEGYQVLAIDEVDRISSTPWAMSTMMAILDSRYSHRSGNATLLATNQNPEKLPAGFEYLASRMKDGDRITVAGKDLRG